MAIKKRKPAKQKPISSREAALTILLRSALYALNRVPNTPLYAPYKDTYALASAISDELLDEPVGAEQAVVGKDDGVQEWAFTIKSVGRGADLTEAWEDVVDTLRDELRKMGPDDAEPERLG